MAFAAEVLERLRFTTVAPISGALRCTGDCRVELSQCSGPDLADRDGDGFPATRDCNDNDPEIHPGMAEILGNNVDDDCNPATPDAIPVAALNCSLVSAQLTSMQGRLIVGSALR